MVNDIHFPVQFQINGQLYHLHFFFETLAFFVGVRIYYHHKKKITDQISDENRLWIMLGAMLGALVGSRLVAVLESPRDLANITFLKLYASKTIIGGLLGSLFGVEVFKKFRGVTVASGDLYVVPIVVALFIGRIGCFLMGVEEPVYGIETDFVLGMDLGDGLLRHPIMLYEMIYLVFLYVLFSLLKHVDLVNGDKFKLFMVMYFTFRFFIEFIKPYQPLFLHLSSIHWSALFILVYYYKFIVRFKGITSKQKFNGQY